MIEKIIQDQNFKHLDVQAELWHGEVKEFDNCRFQNCNFQSVVLSDIRFIDCQFEDSDLSMAKVERTVFQKVSFKGCKLSGVLFDGCDPFSLELQFEQCKLDHSSFMGLKIHDAVFKNCSLKGVDFSDAILKAACFVESDLLEAKFENTLLEKSDFRGATNYAIFPSMNKLKAAIFSLDGLPGLLTEYGIKVMP